MATATKKRTLAHPGKILVCGLACLTLLLAAATSFAAVAREVLPSNVVPLHYELELTPQPEKMRFSAHVRIDIEVREPTRVIKLNAAALEFDRVTLTGSDASPRIRFDTEAETASLEYANALPRGRYALSIDYRGKINQSPAGIFALDYTSSAGVTQRALFTQLENADARRLLPCWDEPGIKATFTLTAIVPQGQLAVSNMPVQRSSASTEGLRALRFQRTPIMSTYLLFFALGDFERAHRRVGKVDLGVVVKRGDTARAQFALDAGEQLLSYYNEYFGTPYPLPKLDFIAGPGTSEFFGAMENWGAIFYFDREILVDTRTSTLADKQRVYVVIAHEMAHQWFGDLVTMAWWDDLWLNEGFASWMQNKATDHFHPEWHIWLQGAASKQHAMEIDAAMGTHPIITPIRNVIEASNAFDTITYSKGAAVIRMLEAYVGADAFRAGVRNYMARHAYANTVSDDLWREVDAVSPRKISDVAHDFTLQAGVPLVSLDSTSCNGGSLHIALKQTRFAVDESGKSGGQLWRVPVDIRSADGRSIVKSVVSGAGDVGLQVRGCGTPLVNAGQASYVRTRYSESALADLLQRFAELAAEDQTGILNDTATLAQAGLVSMAGYLNLLTRVPVDANPIVARTLAGQLNQLDHFYQGLSSQQAFRAFCQELLQPFAAKLGWDPKAGEAENVALERSAVLMLLGTFGDPATVAEARKRFELYLKSPDALSAAVRHTALAIVARGADAAAWEQIHTLARRAKASQEQVELYGLLGEANDPRLIQRLLELSVGTEVPETIRPVILSNASDRFPSLTTAFAISHWKQIEPLLEPNTRYQYVPRLAQRASDPAVIDQLNSFNASFPPAARAAADQAIGRIRYNSSVRSRLAEIDRWLAARP